MDEMATARSKIRDLQIMQAKDGGFDRIENEAF